MQRPSIALRSLLLVAVSAAFATAAAGCPTPEDGTEARTCAKPAGPQVATVSPSTTAPQPAASPDAACAEAAAPAAPSQTGMRAWLDPETGVIGGMPPVEESGEKGAVQDRVFEAVTLPDGSIMVDLQDSLQEYYLMQLDANGQRVVRCVQDPKSLPASAPVAQPEDR